MVMDVTSIAALKAELLKRIREAMLNISIDAQHRVQDGIQKEVYNKYSPKDYQRTGDLKRSVDTNVSMSRNVTKAVIFHNTNLMSAVKPYAGNNEIGQHFSTFAYSPMDYRQYVAETVNFGISAGKKKKFGDGVYARARPYFDNAQKIVEKNFAKNLKASLKSSGLKVV